MVDVVKRGAEAWWGFADVARYLGKSEWWVKREAAAGRLPSFKVGRARHFLPSAIQAWLEQQMRGEGSAPQH